MAWGERCLAGGFGILGLFWIVQALELNYWSDFAPGSGFLPFWLSLILVALVALFLIDSFRRPKTPTEQPLAPAAPPTSTSRTLVIIGGLFVCIAALEWVGFFVAVAAYLVFLLLAVERRPKMEAMLVGVGATVALHLIFRTWLSVPLPSGPWGF